METEIADDSLASRYRSIELMYKLVGKTVDKDMLHIAYESTKRFVRPVFLRGVSKTVEEPGTGPPLATLVAFCRIAAQRAAEADEERRDALRLESGNTPKISPATIADWIAKARAGSKLFQKMLDSMNIAWWDDLTP